MKKEHNIIQDPMVQSSFCFKKHLKNIVNVIQDPMVTFITWRTETNDIKFIQLC
jgi:hypothetical protein